MFDAGDALVDLTAVDFNHDGRLDMAALDGIGNAVVIVLNQGDGQFVVHSKLATAESPARLVVSDWNADGNLDIAVSSLASHAVQVIFGLSSATQLSFSDESFNLPGVVSPLGLAAADLDGDEYSDLLVTDVQEDGALLVYFGHATGTFDGPVSEPVGVVPHDLVVADFNLDGACRRGRLAQARCPVPLGLPAPPCCCKARAMRTWWISRAAGE